MRVAGDAGVVVTMTCNSLMPVIVWDALWHAAASDDLSADDDVVAGAIVAAVAGVVVCGFCLQWHVCFYFGYFEIEFDLSLCHKQAVVFDVAIDWMRGMETAAA